jgi:hypothetical protein
LGIGITSTGTGVSVREALARREPITVTDSMSFGSSLRSPAAAEGCVVCAQASDAGRKAIAVAHRTSALLAKLIGFSFVVGAVKTSNAKD